MTRNIFNEVKLTNPVLKVNDTDYSMNVLVHGHTHEENKISIVDFAPTWKMKQNNVCWEAWYRPVHISELVINTININDDGVWNEFI